MGGSPKRDRTPAPVAPPPPAVKQEPNTIAKGRSRKRRSLRQGVGRGRTILTDQQQGGPVSGTPKRLFGGGG